MRIILIFIVLIGMIFSGCSIDNNIENKMKSPTSPENEKNIAEEEKLDNHKYDNNSINQAESDETFKNFIKLIDDSKPPFKLVGFIERKITKVSTSKADEMMIALEEVQKTYESYYQQQFFNSDYIDDINAAEERGLDKDIIKRINNDSLKSLVSEVLNGGYKLVMVEGSFYPVIDYSYYKRYSKFLSKKMSDYLNIMAIESDKAATSDASFSISLDELTQRILRFEEFTNKYPNFIRNDKLKYMYNNYIKMYLFGLDNSPAYDYKTLVYKDEFIKSFKNFIFNNSGTQSAEIVKEYLSKLKSNDYIYSVEIKDFAFDKLNYTNTLNYKYVNKSLTGLLPKKPGYEWIYNGFAEYGHQMTLENIIKEDKQIRYIIKGNVADMSDGESGKSESYYNIYIEYTINNASLVQTKSENIMMDSKFDSIELIRFPIIKGNKWMQIATDKTGKKSYLNCEITNINEVGDSKVYTVEYKDQDSGYYEIRMIEEGIGVVSFKKLWQTDKGDFEIGYTLYKEVSGF